MRYKAYMAPLCGAVLRDRYLHDEDNSREELERRISAGTLIRFYLDVVDTETDEIIGGIYGKTNERKKIPEEQRIYFGHTVDAKIHTWCRGIKNEILFGNPWYFFRNSVTQLLFIGGYDKDTIQIGIKFKTTEYWPGTSSAHTVNIMNGVGLAQRTVRFLGIEEMLR